MRHRHDPDGRGFDDVINKGQDERLGVATVEAGEGVPRLVTLVDVL